MDLIGGRFADLAAAVAARDAILAAVAVPVADVAVRALGTTQYDNPLHAFVLAGRFPSAMADLAVRLIREHGGAIISRRTEWQASVRPTGQTSAPAAGARPGAPRATAFALKRPRRPAARVRIRRLAAARRVGDVGLPDGEPSGGYGE
jgi:hypothetical protein